jgi:hypothetical protein
VALTAPPRPAQTAQQSAENALHPAAGSALPDIYYVILDAYTRDDTRQHNLNYDNTPFLNHLKQLGFYVAECSQSNYGMTELSLTSSLNMDYLDNLGKQLADPAQHVQLIQLLQSNQVRKNLHQAGYKIVNFESGFSSTEFRDADEFISPNAQFVQNELLGGINPFETLLIKTSAGFLLYDSTYLSDNTWLRTVLDGAYTRHRERILFNLSELGKMPQLPGPKFVFMHIVAPHEPFVFGPNGEILVRRTPFALNNDMEYAEGDLYIQGYRDQVQFLNQRISQAVETILNTSKTPPVIILQGDHGVKPGVSSQNARMTIFNAYYFPGGAGQALYAQISPVNSFRVVFNRYFGAQYPLLKDISYFSDYNTPGQFSVEDNLRPGCSAAK